MTLEFILDLLGKYGPSVLFALFWYLEREERKDSQKELNQVAKDSAVAMTALKDTVNRVIGLLDKLLLPAKR